MANKEYNSWYKKYDINKLISSFGELELEANKIKDIFIICEKIDDTPIFATNNVSEVLSFIKPLRKINKSSYDASNYVNFLEGFLSANNKFRVYDEYRIFKYHKMLEFGGRTQIENFRKIYNSPVVNKYFRDIKLKTILKDD